ncbi:hypothetical protein BN8_p06719 (plasmid) [Fibrisoma limi BUZ 3]|uniref:Uncharacterized protein n=1 Tax=Fibrisoma limi BUZ 3 TaxID=1185876 RepID=I2GTT7_9BACT|nr:hypothetical protein BN8_p06719 [Fibrisoma limi BUZ 3]
MNTDRLIHSAHMSRQHPVLGEGGESHGISSFTLADQLAVVIVQQKTATLSAIPTQV